MGFAAASGLPARLTRPIALPKPMPGRPRGEALTKFHVALPLRVDASHQSDLWEGSREQRGGHRLKILLGMRGEKTKSLDLVRLSPMMAL